MRVAAEVTFEDIAEDGHSIVLEARVDVAFHDMVVGSADEWQPSPDELD